MKNVIRTSWRDAATLIVLSRKKPAIASRQGVNYDILFQTRTASASFANSVVFPGGVSEPVDASEDWLRLFKAFGFDQSHFEAFHRPGAPATPIFQDNPVKRHISLRITAIRETFEELGLLLCCKQHQKDRSSPWACVLPIADISKNPSELLNLCKEYQCYPDIWALHYWSNWLTPTHFPKRFDAAFFITALEDKPECLDFNAEVAHVQVREFLYSLNPYGRFTIVCPNIIRHNVLFFIIFICHKVIYFTLKELFSSELLFNLT
ncbi:hypothetical protein MSG28_011228 [Choristoneura fumiferana]|nr:hypothetical protein MSG28_011228 [Choristoneura fumiferana]